MATQQGSTSELDATPAEAYVLPLECQDLLAGERWDYYAFIQKRWVKRLLWGLIALCVAGFFWWSCIGNADLVRHDTRTQRIGVKWRAIQGDPHLFYQRHYGSSANLFRATVQRKGSWTRCTFRVFQPGLNDRPQVKWPGFSCAPTTQPP